MILKWEKSSRTVCANLLLCFQGIILETDLKASRAVCEAQPANELAVHVQHRIYVFLIAEMGSGNVTGEQISEPARTTRRAAACLIFVVFTDV